MQKPPTVGHQWLADCSKTAVLDGDNHDFDTKDHDAREWRYLSTLDLNDGWRERARGHGYYLSQTSLRIKFRVVIISMFSEKKASYILAPINHTEKSKKAKM